MRKRKLNKEMGCASVIREHLIRDWEEQGRNTVAMRME